MRCQRLWDSLGNYMHKQMRAKSHEWTRGTFAMLTVWLRVSCLLAEHRRCVIVLPLESRPANLPGVGLKSPRGG